MKWLCNIIIIYLLIISIIAVIITVYDKKRAEQNKWRIKESTLLIVSAIGGAIAMYTTMQLIHHKTQKLKFMLGVPAIFLLHTVILTAFAVMHFS